MLKKGFAALVVAGTAAIAAMLASVALGANIICLAGSDTCDGTGANDTITGSLDDDNIFAKGGRDEIEPNPGDDVTIAGPGPDFVFDDFGEDRVVGGTGRDFIDETDDETLSNTINGGPGGDCIGGGDGPDT